MFGFGKHINGPWIITGVQEDPARSEEDRDCNQHCRDQVNACLPRARKAVCLTKEMEMIIQSINLFGFLKNTFQCLCHSFITLCL